MTAFSLDGRDGYEGSGRDSNETFHGDESREEIEDGKKFAGPGGVKTRSFELMHSVGGGRKQYHRVDGDYPIAALRARREAQGGGEVGVGEKCEEIGRADDQSLLDGKGGAKSGWTGAGGRERKVC